MFKVLDHGILKLIHSMGNDRTICDAARVSIEGGVRDGEDTPERDEALIKYLAENAHTSPFEHCSITFYIKAPIFVFRQWHRHRTQSYNEVSGRYSSDIFKEYYVPTAERLMVEQTDNRQGSGKIESKTTAAAAKIAIDKASRESLAQYNFLLKSGTSKELARLVLPLNMYSEMYTTANLLNWCKFLNLRLDHHAQYEIREYANCIYQYLEKRYPMAVKYLVKS